MDEVKPSTDVKAAADEVIAACNRRDVIIIVTKQGRIYEYISAYTPTMTPSWQYILQIDLNPQEKDG
jgi:hypothetical protein